MRRVVWPKTRPTAGFTSGRRRFSHGGKLHRLSHNLLRGAHLGASVRVTGGRHAGNVVSPSEVGKSNPTMVTGLRSVSVGLKFLGDGGDGRSGGARRTRVTSGARHLVLLLLAGAATACVSANDGPTPGAVGKVSHAIKEGVDDVDTPEANAVVRLTSNTGKLCTGTLITPRLVLTALHCVRDREVIGEDPVPVCTDVKGIDRVTSGMSWNALSPGTDPKVLARIGPPGTGMQASVIRSLTAITTCISQPPIGNPEKDIALLQLDRPILGVKSADMELYSTRPDTFTLGSGGGLAGWGNDGNDQPALRRKRMDVPNVPFEHDPGFDGFATIDGNPPGDDVNFGDSGGPLYRTLPDGRRKVLGVLSGFSVGTWWADIGTTAASDWISSNMLSETWVHHTALWYLSHRKDPATMKFGEASYDGQCQRDIDYDCDLWTNDVDNCPATYNPDQAEVDDSQPGSPNPQVQCLACPYSAADASNPTGDKDRDGVCDPPPPELPAPAWRRFDNCPSIKNTDQANCNLASETAHELHVLGDACDPVPCPKFEMGGGEVRFQSGLPYDPYVGRLAFGRIVRDTVIPQPVAPHNAIAGDANGNPRPADAGLIDTDARFCQQNEERRFNCLAPRVMHSDLAGLDEGRDASQPWHRITQRQEGAALTPRGTSYPWRYAPGASVARHIWDFRADWQHWWVSPPDGEPLIPPSEGTACANGGTWGEGTCLDGVLWHHARTFIGDPEDTIPGGAYVGLHEPQLPNPNAGEPDRSKWRHATPGLSNRYERIAPDEAFTLQTKPLGRYRHLWKWQKLVDPLPPIADDTVRRHHVRFVGIDDDKVSHLLHDDGGGEVLGARVSAALADISGEPIAGIAEPDGVVRHVVDGLEGAVVSHDGTSIFDFVVNDGNVLRRASELGWDVTGATSGDAPSPRTDFVTFTSAALGAVFVGGGRVPDGSAPASTVHIFRPGLGWAEITPAGGGFIDPRAMVYSPVDGKLWVLDNVKRARGMNPAVLTLYRVDPMTQETETMGDFAWSAASVPRLFLSLDTTGHVLLTTSRASTSQVTRLDVTGGAVVASGHASLELETHEAPAAGFGELAFVKRSADGVVHGVHRLTTLPAGTVSLGSMFQ